MPVWTVDTWKVKARAEAHFLQHCRALSPEPLILFRDLEKPGLFWSPAKWENRDTLDKWRDGDLYRIALAVLSDDVLEHLTHLMEDVPEFPPRQ